VPPGEETARNGEWKSGPGAHFFESIKEQLGELPFIAEDLGEINDAVLQLRDEFGLSGMKILQFAFGDDFPTSDYIPHNYTPNFIAYTGTHDNNTTRGWYRQEASEETRHRVQQYTARHLTEENIAYFLCRMAHASVAKLAILPMQDVLGLDESARMNTPASGKNNWRWRLLPGQVTKEAEKQLREWTIIYNRD
jgi:4-alpha-glucanotransferase